MSDQPSPEIPASIRQIAEQNVENTRAAYQQFVVLARQAQEMMAGVQGDGSTAVGDLRAKAMRYAEENVDASFRLAAELAQARDLQEYADIQTRYAQTQVLTFGQQARTLTRLLTEAAEAAVNSAMKTGK